MESLPPEMLALIGSYSNKLKIFRLTYYQYFHRDGRLIGRYVYAPDMNSAILTWFRDVLESNDDNYQYALDIIYNVLVQNECISIPAGFDKPSNRTFMLWAQHPIDGFVHNTLIREKVLEDIIKIKDKLYDSILNLAASYFTNRGIKIEEVKIYEDGSFIL